jgi:AcrR family transcriptional regulator
MVGRPRSPACDHAILDAALAEYAANGLDGMSVDAVAARGGVSKATIYRRYPSKAALVVAAALKAADEQAPIADTGSVRGDLTTALRNLRRLLDDPVVGAAKRMLLVDAHRNEELARMHGESVRDRRQGVFDVFRRGVERGELLTDIDVEFAADRVGAHVFYRNLVTRVPITDAYIDQIVDEFLARYGVRQSAALADAPKNS